VYELSKKELANTKQAPGSLEEAMSALEKDHKFLTEGGVFSEDLIETWIQWKREKEIDEIALRPHPHEFHLYYDA
jgi:glutamine synthetase